MIVARLRRLLGARSGARPRDPRCDPALAPLYLRLECPLRADLPTVRSAYLRLVRRYHPDLHSGDARREAIAHRITARLTEAYEAIEQKLSARP